MILPSILEILDRFEKLHPKNIDLSLDRIRRVLKNLGDPHQKLPPVVHVAGTNGKGSTIAFLEAMLTAAGYRVHAYTSPHLLCFKERIKLAGHYIEDDFLETCLLRTEQANEGQALTFFEATSAAAFLAFSRVPADILLLETGLGGRMDATNVVEKPALTVITSIGYDHQNFLGETLAGIAIEKAGIMKQGVPCVVAVQTPEIMAVLQREATIKKAILVKTQKTDTLPKLALTGAHQVDNARTARACLEHLPSFSVSASHIEKGLTTAQWPGRLEKLTFKNLPDDWEVWFDVGHNRQAAEALACWQKNNGKPLALIFASLSDKDPSAFLGAFKDRLCAFRSVPLNKDILPAKRSAFSAEEIKNYATALGFPSVRACQNVSDAIDSLVKEFSDQTIHILVCGSFYLAADFKSLEDYF